MVRRRRIRVRPDQLLRLFLSHARCYDKADPQSGVRCAIRDTHSAGAERYHWTVTVIGEPDPVAMGRKAELADARSQAEAALAEMLGDATIKQASRDHSRQIAENLHSVPAICSN